MKKKLRLKDSIKMYIVIFISVFSILTLFYIVFNQMDINEFNDCLQRHDLDYYNKVVK